MWCDWGWECDCTITYDWTKIFNCSTVKPCSIQIMCRVFIVIIRTGQLWLGMIIEECKLYLTSNIPPPCSLLISFLVNLVIDRLRRGLTVRSPHSQSSYNFKIISLQAAGAATGQRCPVSTLANLPRKFAYLVTRNKLHSGPHCRSQHQSDNM